MPTAHLRHRKHPYGVRKFSPGLRPSGLGWRYGERRPIGVQIDNPTSSLLGLTLVYVSDVGQSDIKVYDASDLQRTVVVPTDTDPNLTGVAVSHKFILRWTVTFGYVWSLDGSFQRTLDLSTGCPA